MCPEPGELGEPVRPDGEVARAAGLDRVLGQPAPEEGHDLAEVDRPLHRLVAKVVLVVRPRSRGPLPPARLDRCEGRERRGEIGQRGHGRKIGLEDEAQLTRVWVDVDERCRRVRRLEQRVAPGRHGKAPEAKSMRTAISRADRGTDTLVTMREIKPSLESSP